MRQLKLGGFAILAMVASGALTGAQAQFGGPPPGTPPSATAMIYNARGMQIGPAGAWSVPGGVAFAVRVEGLRPGLHGIHIHHVGKCEEPDFASASSHMNTTEKRHGMMNPAGHHVGDLPNLVIDQQGRGTLDFTVQGLSIDQVLGGDGSAIVIHDDADDLKTDPAGNSGARIACGVFAKFTPPAMPARPAGGPPPRQE